MAFTHLHVHTEYSLLDGSNKIKEYVARVKELGMNSAAITDHGVMYGVIDFYRAAREAGIKPILGCEVYVAPNSRFDKELTGGEDRYHHLVLLAENNTGYANLMKIVSRGFTEGYYYKPRVDMGVLQQFHEGIIALSACLAGEVPRLILKGMKEEARMAARKYEACFGKGNYFLELQDHGIPEQRTVNMELIQMSRELDIPLVTTNDVHYTYAEDAIPHDILLCLQTGKVILCQQPAGKGFLRQRSEIIPRAQPLGVDPLSICQSVGFHRFFLSLRIKEQSFHACSAKFPLTGLSAASILQERPSCIAPPGNWTPDFANRLRASDFFQPYAPV